MGGGENSGLDPAMLHVFLWNLLAFTCLGIILTASRYRLQRLQNELEAEHARLALAGGGR
jgi:hypothetical protein